MKKYWKIKNNLSISLIAISTFGCIFFTACATSSQNKGPFPNDELPKSPRVAALDPVYVSKGRAKKASISEYKQALTRSQGFLFNMRVMPITEAYQSFFQPNTSTPADANTPTCFRLEFDTYDKETALPENWSAEFVSSEEEKETLEVKIDPDSIEGLEKKRSLQLRASLCSSKKLNLLPHFKVSLIRKYKKKPEAEIFEWTEWKPGISSSPVRVRW